MIEYGGSAFGSEAAALRSRGEAPTDLDDGLWEVRYSEAHCLCADDSDEVSSGAVFDGEHGETIAFELRVVPVGRVVALFRGKWSREELHDRGVSVHLREGCMIARLPLTEQQSRRDELDG